MCSWSLISCADTLETSLPIETEEATEVNFSQKLTEVAPPPVIQELSQTLEQYQPQITIVSPQANEISEDTSIDVKLEVRDLPIFQNAEFELGPHVHLILDNEPYRAIYNIDEPITLENLAPGTHTLRAFASRPWDESFKNEGAYAQTTFHVFTKTEDNNPDSSLPLLTYSRPKGNYGAEPIMLDFYLTNAPLHLVARENAEDDIKDWRIQITVNGQSFLVDSWQPVYLTGFEPGKNWVELEFIDEDGNNIDNVFNNTVRVITYEPNGQDTLSKIVRGELSTEVVRGIVDANYEYQPTIAPVAPETPKAEVIEPSEEITPEILEVEPETPTAEVIEPSEEITPEILEVEPETPKAEVIEPSEEITPEILEVESETPKAEIIEPSEEITPELEVEAATPTAEVIDLEENS